jgi:hypothetical protein
MAGRWKGSKFEWNIRQLGGLEWILVQVRSGHSLRQVARQVGCGRWWLDRWIYADPGRREAVLQARAAAASKRSIGPGAKPLRASRHPFRTAGAGDSEGRPSHGDP